MDQSEIRKDYFLDKYVIIAPKRAKRPKLTALPKEVEATKCYFCPDKLANDEIVMQRVDDKDGNWKILALKNKFPALSLDNPRAFGTQELIVETPKHQTEIHELPIEDMVETFDVCIDRYVELSKIKGVRYTLVFKNEGGRAAGESIPHAHSQIISLPMLPPQIKDEFMAYADYQLEHNSCPYCDILKKEKGKGRIVWEDENLVALCPFASESPYGVWLLPKRHIKTMDQMTTDEKKSLAEALKLVLGRLDELNIPFNYFFHNGTNDDYHMHLKISPRPNVWAGLELGTGVVINPIPPEFAAKLYRGEIEIETTEDKKHLKVF